MKTYPSIQKLYGYSETVYAFDKLDGSNIRAEWNKKKGFHKFGSRRRLIDQNDEQLGEAVGLILAKYGDELSRIFTKEKQQQVICFFEFYGPKSFAGNHEDEEHTVTLFDVNFHKKGIMPPKDFLHLFGHLDIPKLLHHGNANKDFEKSVKESTLEGITFEGVVCKVQTKNHMNKCFKIKTEAWLEKLKAYCKGDEKLFKELA